MRALTHTGLLTLILCQPALSQTAAQTAGQTIDTAAGLQQAVHIPTPQGAEKLGRQQLVVGIRIEDVERTARMMIRPGRQPGSI